MSVTAVNRAALMERLSARLGVVGLIPFLLVLVVVGMTLVAEARMLAGAIPTYAGKRLFFYYNSGLVTVIDQASASVVGQLPIGGGTNTITAIAGTGELYASTADGTAAITDAAQAVTRLLPLAFDAPYNSIAATSRQFFLASFYQLFAMDLTRKAVSALRLPYFYLPNWICTPVHSTTISPDQTKMLLSVANALCGPPDSAAHKPSGQEGIGIHDTRSDQLIGQAAIDAPGTGAFTPDGKTAYVSSSTPYRSSIKLVDVATVKVTGAWIFPSIPGLSIVAPSPDGATLYAIGWNSPAGTAYAIDTASGTIRDQYALPQSTFQPWAALTPDGSTLMITGLNAPYNQSLLMLDVATGSQTLVATDQVLGPLAIVP
jgi:DNA-binding beta-propeller fold protein YncE